MRCCSAHPQPAITLQWRSAYVIYDCVYVFALYGAFNVLFLLRCPATVALWVGSVTFPSQTCNPVGKDQQHFWPCVAFYPSPDSRHKRLLRAQIRILALLSTFSRFVPSICGVFLRTEAENAAECTIQSAPLMQIVGIWPVETFLRR